MENKFRSNLDETVKYYEEHAQEFIESTISADVTELYEHFEKHLTSDAKILDLGCGSGRDSKYFVEKGYRVVAIDPSAAMCEQTRELAHIPVYQMKAEQMNFSNEFDAVWACASLLHVPLKDQGKVLQKITDALKTGGILYASWKYGEGEYVTGERCFINMNEKDLHVILKSVSKLETIKIWETQDVRKNMQHQKWINVLTRKID